MVSYYRTVWEGIGADDGHYYAEVKSGEIVRQIVAIGDVLYWATLHECSNELYDFTDQPEVSEEELEGFEEISVSDFESLWLRAKVEGCR